MLFWNILYHTTDTKVRHIVKTIPNHHFALLFHNNNLFADGTGHLARRHTNLPEPRYFLVGISYSNPRCRIMPSHLHWRWDPSGAQTTCHHGGNQTQLLPRSAMSSLAEDAPFSRGRLLNSGGKWAPRVCLSPSSRALDNAAPACSASLAQCSYPGVSQRAILGLEDCTPLFGHAWHVMEKSLYLSKRKARVPLHCSLHLLERRRTS